MERPKAKYFCNKCGYVGTSSEHAGCGYFACTTLEYQYLEIVEAQRDSLAEQLAAAKLDAERWKLVELLMFVGDVELKQDEDGGYSISVDPAENIIGKIWKGNSPEEAIDSVMQEKRCTHLNAVTQYTGDGTPVEFCPDCGKNSPGRVSFDNGQEKKP